MLLSRVLIIFIDWLQFHRTYQISNYVGHVIDVASDCPGKKPESLFNYFDSSNVQVDWTDDGYIVLNGYSYILQRIDPNQKILFKLSILQNIQGQWMNSLIGIVRQDACSHLMDPNGPWHGIFDQLEADQQKCPPQMGLKYPFNNKTIEMFASAPSAGIEGEYKAVIDISFKEGHLLTVFLVRVVKLKD